MISILMRILKENKGFIIILSVLVLAGISIVSSVISEDSNNGARNTPVSAPSSPSNPELVEEGEITENIDLPLLSEQEIVQSDEIDQLLFDAAVDTAMAVVSIGFETDYQIGHQDRLSILRSMVSKELLGLFSAHYANEDWERVSSEKIQILVEILKVETVPEISTGSITLEIDAEYRDGARNPVKSSNPAKFLLVLERTYDFNAWQVVNINFD